MHLARSLIPVVVLAISMNPAFAAGSGHDPRGSKPAAVHGAAPTMPAEPADPMRGP